MLKLSQRLFFSAAFCATLGSGACGGDDAVPLEPVTYELAITGYNGKRGDEVTPHCDGTLSVTVAVSPPNTFQLRPANACGTSPRCGYVHFELLDNGEVVSTADSVTLQGVLRVTDLTRLSELELQVSLRSGVDQKTIVNADGTDAVLLASPTFLSPGSCEDSGAGGAGGTPGAGGAGGQPSEAAAGAGGVGGASELPVGGAGGAPSGGAGGGGEAALAGAGGA